MRRSAGSIGAVAALRHQAFETHLAGRLEQVGTDLAPFEIVEHDAVDTAIQEAR